MAITTRFPGKLDYGALLQLLQAAEALGFKPRSINTTDDVRQAPTATIEFMYFEPKPESPTSPDPGPGLNCGRPLEFYTPDR